MSVEAAWDKISKAFSKSQKASLSVEIKEIDDLMQARKTEFLREHAKGKVLVDVRGLSTYIATYEEAAKEFKLKENTLRVYVSREGVRGYCFTHSVDYIDQSVKIINTKHCTAAELTGRS